MNKTIISCALTVFMLVSCDEGRLYEDADIVLEQEGGKASITVDVSNEDTWADHYTLAVAGFEEGNDFALISKNILPSLLEGRCDITLTGIPAEVSKLELCALDRLRRRVTTFATVEYNQKLSTAEGYEIDLGTIDLAISTAIQRDIFNTTCIQCHGGSNYSAAGLNLTQGNSFSQLIDVYSVKEPGEMRVRSGSSAESLLYDILSGNKSTGWRYDHSVEIVRSERLQLLRDWIDGGAIVR